MFKKILSCLFICAFCLSALLGCAKDGTPDGMFSATVAGEPFVLYVPDGWVDNRDSGISSAYYSLSEAVTVSARSYPTPEGSTLDAYIERCVSEYSKGYPSFALVGKKESGLGSASATRLEYTFDRVVESNGSAVDTKVNVIQYYTVYGSDIVILSFYCAANAYAENTEYAEMFEQIRAEFVLCERSDGANEVVTDKKTPEGMKLASYDEAEYCMYVPLSWVCNMSDKFSQAYYPESGKPNVSVTSFYPDSPVSAAEYFAMCQDTYRKDISGYEILSEQERTVGGRAAISYTYKAVYGDVEYRITQTVFEYNELIYSFTYTALADRFDAHTDDVEKMLDSFRFR